MNVAALFSEPRCAPARHLAQLGGRLAELRGEARAAQIAASADRDRRDALARELVTAEASLRAWGGAKAEAEVKTARARLDRIEKSLARRVEEDRLATAAAAVVEEEVGRYAAEHAAALQAELEEDARTATSRLQVALQEIHGAYQVHQQVGMRHEALTRLVDPDRHRVQRLPTLSPALTALAKEAGGITIPPPLLRPLGTVASVETAAA